MMKQVNVHEAKTRLSRLLEQVESGEEIVIARNGKPVALLSRYIPVSHVPRRPGRLKGRIRIAEDFDAPDSMTDALLNGPVFPDS
ncbi:MAG: type II toxin-antitoxin system Phd/YefM family antitoxin [Gammaproteobacteria bacterium]